MSVYSVTNHDVQVLPLEAAVAAAAAAAHDRLSGRVCRLVSGAFSVEKRQKPPLQEQLSLLVSVIVATAVRGTWTSQRKVRRRSIITRWHDTPLGVH